MEAMWRPGETPGTFMNLNLGIYKKHGMKVKTNLYGPSKTTKD